jgi:hypothetical protein
MTSNRKYTQAKESQTSRNQNTQDLDALHRFWMQEGAKTSNNSTKSPQSLQRLFNHYSQPNSLKNAIDYNTTGLIVPAKEDRLMVLRALKSIFKERAKAFYFSNEGKLMFNEEAFVGTENLSPHQQFIFDTFVGTKKRPGIVRSKNIRYKYSIVDSFQSNEYKRLDGTRKLVIVNDATTFLPNRESYRRRKQWYVHTEALTKFNDGILEDTYLSQKNAFKKAHPNYNKEADLDRFRQITFWHEVGHLLGWKAGYTWYLENQGKGRLLDSNKTNFRYAIGYENLARIVMGLPLRVGTDLAHKGVGYDPKELKKLIYPHKPKR